MKTQRLAVLSLVGLLAPTLVQAGNIAKANSGEVVIRSWGERTIVVAVDRAEDENGPDGYVDYTFVFSRHDASKEQIDLRYPYANVEYSRDGGSLRVTAPEAGQIALLKVDIEGKLPELSKVLGETVGPLVDGEPGEWRIYDGSGVGLSVRKTGKGGATLDEIAYGSMPWEKAGPPTISNDDLGGGTSGAACTSGGPGSTSCQKSCAGGESCFVTCVRPAYPCCRCSGSTAICVCKT